MASGSRKTIDQPASRLMTSLHRPMSNSWSKINQVENCDLNCDNILGW